MLTIPRAVIRSFRAVLRHSVWTRQLPRHCWPPVSCFGNTAGLILQSGCGEVGLRYFQPGLSPQDEMIVPAALLADLEGSTQELVRLERRSKTKA